MDTKDSRKAIIKNSDMTEGIFYQYRNATRCYQYGYKGYRYVQH